MKRGDAVDHLEEVDRRERAELERKQITRRTIAEELIGQAANVEDLLELTMWRRLHPGLHLPGEAAPAKGEEDKRKAAIIGKCRLCGLAAAVLRSGGCPGKIGGTS